MITTLIIDDNKIIREYFQTMIDWEAKGFDLVAIANNGISGWHEFNEHLPQLVITDVQMPGMSGLELSRMIKETAPDTMIVFISNYEDFNYVKGAMEVGAYDYILKHETRGIKFEEKLEKIKKHFEKYNQSRRNYIESKLILAFSSISNPKLEQILPNQYSLVILEQASLLPTLAKLANTDINEIDETVFQSYFTSHPRNVICGIRVEKYRYAVLLNPCCDIDHFSNQLCSHIYAQTKIRCYALPLAKAQPINSCLSAYRIHKELINSKFFFKHDSLIRTNKYPSDHINNQEIDSDDVISILNQADIDKTCEMLDHYSHIITKHRNYAMLCNFVSVILNFIINNSKNLSNNEFVPYNESDINFWTSADEILFWLKNKLIKLLGILKQNPIHTYSQPVRNAIDYINLNYPNSNLAVGDIAQHVGLDTNRLNKLIKDETGLTAIKWITNVRMEKAKELLRQNKKLNNIYSDVGYTNISYFSNVFKKVCGVTPLEYRRNSFEKES